MKHEEQVVREATARCDWLRKNTKFPQPGLGNYDV